MKPENHSFTAQVGGRSVVFESGKLASLANGAVTVRLGDTMIFAAATMGSPREGADFLPLGVFYEERLYAGGRIPGSFFRREGRPSTEATLIARLTDRPLRPLFPKGMRNDLQVLMYSFSSDGENPIDILAINAASAALTISDIPWNGPVGAVRVGRIEGEFIINPTFQQMEVSDLDLRLAGTREAILMVECGADEIPEDVLVEALELGHKAIQPLIEAQEAMRAAIGKPKQEVQLAQDDEELNARVRAEVETAINDLIDNYPGKAAFHQAIEDLKTQVVAALTNPEDAAALAEDAVKKAFHAAEKAIIRERILAEGKRPDGRQPEDIRNIWCEVNYSPRAHGSAIFTRGETQVLTLATLGTLGEAQTLDTLNPQESKRYMHHYNFPPFSTGEVRPLRGQSRREIGHGALAERALEPVIPPETDFPYTIRLVSEVLSSNGSSSMASVCGSTLALMDTGVPIKAPVAGVAMGLVTDGERYRVLTDIQGMEDHLGDMDFKVAGTDKGITALQMDIKIAGLSRQIMEEALAQARKARLFILDQMMAVIAAPRPDLKPHVPRITSIKIPVDKIGAVIGPGGKIIRSIQADTGTTIDIAEDGTVYIAATDAEGARQAVERIQSLTEEPEIGHIYTGRVVRVTDFGAFVEILPGTDGMVHISQLDSVRVNKVEDVVNVGDEITVMVTNIDANGRIRLSRQAVLEGWTAEEAQERDRSNKRNNRSGGRGGRNGHNRRPRR